MNDLNKADKKIARILIDKGVNKAFAKALEDAEKTLQQWRENRLDNRDAYQALFKKVKEHDKGIARRYDALGGSDYLVTVCSLYVEKVLTDEDIEPFSDATKQQIQIWAKVLNR